jgi:sulfotransferase family protein
MEKPIFVIGLPRSGSTLLENIIARNPEIFRLAEMLFLSPWRKDFRYFLKTSVGDLTIDKNVKKMVDLIFSPRIISGLTGSFWRFENIRAFNEPMLKEQVYHKLLRSDKTLGSIFKILIEEITRYNGYSRCSVAFPVYPSHFLKLVEWYPKCKVIYITRDPRAIAMSKTNDPTGTAIRIKKYPRLRFFIRKVMILFVIVQYVWASKIHSKFKGNENYSLIRYEDLVLEPEMVIKELCKFCEIEFSSKMLDPDEGMPSSITGIKYKGINKKNASNWESIISPIEKFVITSITMSSTKRFGFDPKNHPVYFY